MALADALERQEARKTRGPVLQQRGELVVAREAVEREFLVHPILFRLRAL